MLLNRIYLSFIPLYIFPVYKSIKNKNTIMTEDSTKCVYISLQKSSTMYTEEKNSFHKEDNNEYTFHTLHKKTSNLPPSLVNSHENDKPNFNLFDGCNIFKKENHEENEDQNESDEEENAFVKKEAVNLDKEEEDEDDFIKKASAETNDTSVTYFNLPKSLVPEENANDHKFPYEEDLEEELDETNEKINMIYPLLDSDDEEKLNEETKENDIKENDPFNTEENKLLLSNLIELAKEQTSCRYLQQIIDKNPKMGTVFFYPTIINNIADLITNQFGNYLIQKLFSYINQNQFTDILNAIAPNFVSISTNFYGTRVLQKMIDCINNQYQMLSLLKIISANISEVLNDINASHIVNKLLSLRQFYITSAIYEMVNRNFLTIALDKHGCCSIQKLLENDLIFTDKIILNILNNAMTLITHQYGNYIIQFLIQSKNKMITFRLITILIPNFGKLAKLKYSSTVLEKCFEYCDEQSKSYLYNVLYNKGVLKALIFDKFGNYVVQKAIDSAHDEKVKFYLLRLIAPMINDVKKENFGKQMCLKLCSKYPEFQEYMKNFKKTKYN